MLLQRVWGQDVWVYNCQTLWQMKIELHSFIKSILNVYFPDITF